MGDCLRANEPCPCGISSDAYQYYTDGEYCFSCAKGFPPSGIPGQLKRESKDSGKNILQDEPGGDATYEYRADRGISVETMQHFGVLTKCINGTPSSIMFPTVRPHRGGKVRSLTEKKFLTVGENPENLLFGQESFPPGCSDTITITEGEYDALSIYEATGRPAVSIRGSSSARKDCAAQFKYLNSFPTIKLACDADEPGQRASLAIAELFEFNRVKTVSFEKELKDANGYLQAGRTQDLRRLWYNATRFMPAGVLSTFADFDAAIDDETFQKPIATFPFRELEEKLQGLRQGEITLLTAQEGIGKTEIIRAIEHHILKTTDLNLGIIHLEENKARTIKGLVGLSLGEPVHLPDSQVSSDELKSGLRNLVRREDRLHVYSNFGGDDPDSICDLIRFLVVACDCKVVTLDHITMLATGRAGEEDERRFLDALSTKMARMVNELQFHLILISHINDDGKTRGSRNISKIASNRVDLYRDIISPNDVERNTTTLTVSKARFSSLTGPAGSLFFDRETFTLKPVRVNEPEELPT